MSWFTPKETPKPAEGDKFAPRLVKPSLARVFNPEAWRTMRYGVVVPLYESNCMSYALDRPDLLWQHLGALADNDLKEASLWGREGFSNPAFLADMAKKDGLVPVKPAALNPKHHNVAVFGAAASHYNGIVDGVAVDFHVIRQDKNGLWSEKCGTGPVRNKDKWGQVLKTENLTAHYNECMTEYMPEPDRKVVFAGFFRVPDKGVIAVPKKRFADHMLRAILPIPY